MDKQAAAKIIRDTFEKPFDKGRFITFSKNLVNYLDDSKNFAYRGNIIPDAYKQYIHTLERIGKYQDANDNKIDILIAQLKKETSLERARTMQRNFIAWYLNGSRGGDLKDAALVAFVSPDSEDWRFSLVKMDYLLEESPSGKTKVKTELTPARRFSFLVGENESSHTAQSQLVDILADDRNSPTLSILENAFNIEVATREFFNRYRQLFHKVQESLDELVQQDEAIREDFKAKGVNTVNFSKKLLGQVIFLYFLQKKGWLGVPGNKNWGEGNKKFLRTLFEKCNKERKNFFNDYLEYLFYAALNNEDRGGIDPSYYPKFECRIPFLNGGLFTSDYDWEKTKIVIPNDIFSDRRDDNDEGSGILDIFDLYNFTVKEDEPLEKEVAVDPEMLGKVFENLLEVKDRKSKGTYYTPREIVHYMCQESLINYLDTAVNTGEVPLVPTRPPQAKLFGKPDPQQVALKTREYKVLIPREDIETLIRYGDLTIENEVVALEKQRDIQSGKIKSTSCKPILRPSIEINAKLIDDKLKNIRVCDPAIGSGAFPVGLMTEIVRARTTLTTYLADKQERTNYNFKRHAIQNCLYGVDIDPGAVEIAKLRLWLSLVVDEQDIRQIKPLPNLDYKIVCGNSLLGVEKNLFNLELFNEFEKQKLLYFDETDVKKKQEYKSQIDDLINQITNNSRDFDFEVYFSEVFHERGGFDVVIANPPYVEFKKLQGEIKKSLIGYKTTHGKYDLYIAFLEKAGVIIGVNGICVFICPTRFMKRDYGSSLRKLISQDFELIEIVDFADIQMFEAAINYTGIFIFTKKRYGQHFKYKSFEGRSTAQFNLEKALVSDSSNDLVEVINVPTLAVSADAWYFHNQMDNNIISKMRADATPLSGLCEGIFQGIATGKDSVFIVDENAIEQHKIEKAIIVPILKGKDIKRYFIKWSGNYLIYPYDMRGIVYSENMLKNSFGNTYKYLQSMRNKLKGRAYFDKSTKRWYELWNQRKLNRFMQTKIITLDNAKGNSFTLENGVYVGTTTTYSIILKDKTVENYRYILGVLNSSLLEYSHRKTTIPQAGGFYRYQAIFIETLPIRLASRRESIANLVERVIGLTQSIGYSKDASKQAKVKEYERQIDQMVYQLYDLTPEEIAVVEGLAK